MNINVAIENKFIFEIFEILFLIDVVIKQSYILQNRLFEFIILCSQNMNGRKGQMSVNIFEGINMLFMYS